MILVNVAFSRDFGDALQLPIDNPFDTNGMPEDWTDLVDGLYEHSDLKVTKRHWNAFYGTDLELRRSTRSTRP